MEIACRIKEEKMILIDTDENNSMCLFVFERSGNKINVLHDNYVGHKVYPLREGSYTNTYFSEHFKVLEAR